VLSHDGGELLLPLGGEFFSKTIGGALSYPDDHTLWGTIRVRKEDLLNGNIPYRPALNKRQLLPSSFREPRPVLA